MLAWGQWEEYANKVKDVSYDLKEPATSVPPWVAQLKEEFKHLIEQLSVLPQEVVVPEVMKMVKEEAAIAAVNMFVDGLSKARKVRALFNCSPKLI